MNRRTVLKAGVVLASTAHAPAGAPMIAEAAEPREDVVRRVARDLATALKQCGGYEYAYVRPEGVEFPVLLASRTDASTLANFYFTEYLEAVTQTSYRTRQRHIRQIESLLSLLKSDRNGAAV